MYLWDGVHVLFEAARGCAALVGNIIQLERHKCLMPKLKQKKKNINISKFDTNESSEAAQWDLRETATVAATVASELPVLLISVVQFSWVCGFHLYFMWLLFSLSNFNQGWFFSIWPAHICSLSFCVTSFSFISANKHLNWTISSMIYLQRTSFGWNVSWSLMAAPFSVWVLFSFDTDPPRK